MSTVITPPRNQTAANRQILLGQLTDPVRHFMTTEAASAALLVAATLLAVAWANSPWSDSYERLWSTVLAVRIGDAGLTMDLGHWMNDGLMVVFFFVVGLEVRREISVGELSQVRRMILPAIGAVGGLAVPALLYLLLNPSGEAAQGWGVVIGTDTAFVLGALALVGPKVSTQLRVFLLTMTVFDDVLAIGVIGIVYSDDIDMLALALAGACLASLALLSWFRVWQTTAYVVVVILLWLATIQSGLHASIAGMTAGLLIGAYPPRREDIDRAASLFRAFRQSPLPSVGYSAKMGLERSVSVNERLQEVLHGWTSFAIVPVFALANAGVDLRDGRLADALSSPVTWGVVVGLVAGKPIGSGLLTLAAERAGAGSLPQGVGPGQVLGGAALSGMGFTVSLLIVGLAFDTPVLREEATIGVLLAAMLSVGTGWIVFHLAAVLHGEWSASLPVTLAHPVDAGRDHIRGPVDAPLTLVEYGDFECPFCSAATGVLRDLHARFGDELRYVFRHLPLVDVHAHAETAAVAAEAAGAQDRFWEMHDLLFQHTNELTVEDLVGYAGTLGLDVELFTRALSDNRHAEHVREDVASADASGVRGTPTFFIGNTRHIGPYDAETLAAALETTHPPLAEGA